MKFLIQTMKTLQEEAREESASSRLEKLGVSLTNENGEYKTLTELCASIRLHTFNHNNSA